MSIEHPTQTLNTHYFLQAMTFFKGNHLIRQGQVLIKLDNLLLSDEWAREEIKKEI